MHSAVSIRLGSLWSLLGNHKIISNFLFNSLIINISALWIPTLVISWDDPCIYGKPYDK
uniref:Uncharacterized protein n=1 Tax=Anguilla anguilla TaxID=7936 RepID=A0A0E9W9C0_ANGAN